MRELSRLVNRAPGGSPGGRKGGFAAHGLKQVVRVDASRCRSYLNSKVKAMTSHDDARELLLGLALGAGLAALSACWWLWSLH